MSASDGPAPARARGRTRPGSNPLWSGATGGTSRRRIPGVVERIDPSGPTPAVVLDSPHSGRHYPADFDPGLDRASLRRIEDAYVDELFGDVEAHGAVLVHALFARSYIDPNRAPDDLDEDLLDGDWPHPLTPTAKSRLGIGLIPAREPGGNVYSRKLAVAEVARRLDDYYHPYHRVLGEALDESHAAHGAVYHLDCHSMPAIAASGVGPRSPVVDVVIGDRDATTCERAFTSTLVRAFGDLGLVVAVNDPYAGVEIVRRCGAPREGRHSLQIELRRGLYLDEKRVEKSADFPALRKAMSGIVRTVGRYAAERLVPSAAE